MSEINLRNFAYLGDAVWELFIRKKTVTVTNNSKNLHKITTNKVKASYQADLFELMLEYLTEEEKEISRRARNLPIPVGRRQIQNEYRHATAFETLIGWWYFYDKIRLENMLQKLEIHLEF